MLCNGGGIVTCICSCTDHKQDDNWKEHWKIKGGGAIKWDSKRFAKADGAVHVDRVLCKSSLSLAHYDIKLKRCEHFMIKTKLTNICMKPKAKQKSIFALRGLNVFYSRFKHRLHYHWLCALTKKQLFRSLQHGYGKRDSMTCRIKCVIEVTTLILLLNIDVCLTLHNLVGIRAKSRNLV